MSLSITLGWWLLPLAATVAALAWGFWPEPSERNIGPYSFPIIGVLKLAGALILTLLAWTIYLSAALIWMKP